MTSKESKNAQIKATLSATRNRRKSQMCKVVVGKIQNLNKEQLNSIQMQFIEAKWLVNEMISFGKDHDIWKYKSGKEVIHKNKFGDDVTTCYKFLSAQSRQSIVKSVINDIKILSSMKRRGKKVGCLKFRKKVDAIDLPQFSVTYRLVNQYHVEIAKIKGKIRINGFDILFNKKGKIKRNIEVANAKLLDKPDGYYLSVTYFIPKKEKQVSQNKIGIDLGCSTTLTTSNGDKINVLIEETDRIKRLQRKLARQKKGSNNRYKTRLLLQRAYQNLHNKKEDISNQIVARLTKDNQIFMQDEQLSNWAKTGHGKKVQHSILGRLKTKFIAKGANVISKWEPTTRTCCACGHKNPKQHVSVRIFKCEDCGHSMDRDVNAANNMIYMYQIGREPAKFTPVERQTSIDRNISKSDSAKQEGANVQALEATYVVEAVEIQ